MRVNVYLVLEVYKYDVVYVDVKYRQYAINTYR